MEKQAFARLACAPVDAALLELEKPSRSDLQHIRAKDMVLAERARGHLEDKLPRMAGQISILGEEIARYSGDNSLNVSRVWTRTITANVLRPVVGERS